MDINYISKSSFCLFVFIYLFLYFKASSLSTCLSPFNLSCVKWIIKKEVTICWIQIIVETNFPPTYDTQ
jgi:hypothetical protein